MNDDKLEELTRLLAELNEDKRLNKLKFYKPYQKQKDFHAAGKKWRERCLMGGNQTGKTHCGSAEASYHLTGDYPDGWEGKRFSKPVMMWAASETNDLVVKGIQTHLVGKPGEKGTGMIPADRIIKATKAVGVPDLLNSVWIKHKSGGTSRMWFKSYKEGREAWQAATLDLVWFDEEPPIDIYTEGLTRTNATNGIVYLTFTPLKGRSEVVNRLQERDGIAASVTYLGIDDVEHYSEEKRAEIIASYPAHERDARAKGIPVLGSGAVYPISEDEIRCDRFKIPDDYVQIGAIDFGWDHPTAAVKLAWDRETDIVYLTRAYRKSQLTPILHAETLKPWGVGMPWSYPHDGDNTEKGSGETMATIYRSHGLNMLPTRATFEDGTSRVEPGIQMILERMQTGRFKVFADLNDWWDEFRKYYRKNGKINKTNDDLMDATRYAMMMLRYAEHTEEVRRRMFSQERKKKRRFSWMGR